MSLWHFCLGLDQGWCFLLKWRCDWSVSIGVNVDVACLLLWGCTELKTHTKSNNLLRMGQTFFHFGIILFQYDLFEGKPCWRTGALWHIVKGVYKYTLNIDMVMLQKKGWTLNTQARALCTGNASGIIVIAIPLVYNLIARSDRRSLGFIPLPFYYRGHPHPWYRIQLTPFGGKRGGWVCSAGQCQTTTDSNWSASRGNSVQCTAWENALYVMERNVLLEGATFGGLKATETAYRVSEG